MLSRLKYSTTLPKGRPGISGGVDTAIFMNEFESCVKPAGGLEKFAEISQRTPEIIIGEVMLK